MIEDDLTVGSCKCCKLCRTCSLVTVITMYRGAPSRASIEEPRKRIHAIPCMSSGCDLAVEFRNVGV
jgi:hypothetical protein